MTPGLRPVQACPEEAQQNQTAAKPKDNGFGRRRRPECEPEYQQRSADREKQQSQLANARIDGCTKGY
ncbi:MAG TPA: hypothetical protein VF011_05595 [Terriglobales bacterium]